MKMDLSWGNCIVLNVYLLVNFFVTRFFDNVDSGENNMSMEKKDL